MPVTDDDGKFSRAERDFEGIWDEVDPNTSLLSFFSPSWLLKPSESLKGNKDDEVYRLLSKSSWKVSDFLVGDCSIDFRTQ